MATSYYATDTLVSLVKNLESMPTSQNTFTDEDFVNLMNYELQNGICPILLKTNEEYFVKYEDFSVDQNTQYLEIPSSAIGMRCRDVWWTNSSNTNFMALQRIAPEVVASGWGYGFGNTSYYGQAGYTLQQNRIVFYPRLQGAGTVRIFYFRRPNRLVTTSLAGEIVSIDTGANTVTLDTAPDTDTWDTGTILDAIHNYQPFDFAEEEIEVLDRTGLTFEFSPEVIANLSVGDWLTLTGTSAFPQYIPVEAQGVLVQGTAVKCLQSIGDLDGFKVAQTQYANERSALIDMITPRVQGQPKKIGNRGHGIMTNNGNWYNGWGN